MVAIELGSKTPNKDQKEKILKLVEENIKEGRVRFTGLPFSEENKPGRTVESLIDPDPRRSAWLRASLLVLAEKMAALPDHSLLLESLDLAELVKRESPAKTATREEADRFLRRHGKQAIEFFLEGARNGELSIEERTSTLNRIVNDRKYVDDWASINRIATLSLDIARNQEDPFFRQDTRLHAARIMPDDRLFETAIRQVLLDDKWNTATVPGEFGPRGGALQDFVAERMSWGDDRYLTRLALTLERLRDDASDKVISARAAETLGKFQEYVKIRKNREDDRTQTRWEYQQSSLDREVGTPVDSLAQRIDLNTLREAFIEYIGGTQDWMKKQKAFRPRRPTRPKQTTGLSADSVKEPPL